MWWCRHVRQSPRNQKIHLEKVMGALNTVCPKYWCSISPDRIPRIDFERMVCPECGERFVPQKPTNASKS